MTENRRQKTENEDSLSSVFRRLSSVLRNAGIDNPDFDTRILAAYTLGLDRAQVLAQADRVLTSEETRRIKVLIERRARHEPVARILGMREFWSLPFGLNEATLVPRPESETLVEAALNFLPPGERNLRILDLGTGSGCLLLALLHELPHASGLGVDCAARAVEQATENAKRIGLSARAEFCIKDWTDNIKERFDLIVCNPPYIPRKDIATLMRDVRDYDPLLALDGGDDGLDIYRLLIPQLPQLLKRAGTAIFEIGIGQANVVNDLFQKSGFAKFETKKDLGGIERCVIATGSLLSSG